MVIRLRYMISTRPEDLGVTAPAVIGVAVGLLTRRQWRAGEVAALQAVAEQLGWTSFCRPSTARGGRRGPGERPCADRGALPAAAKPGRRSCLGRFRLSRSRALSCIS